MAVSFKKVMDVATRCEEGLENVGLCTACGAERDGCEPDAEDYECEECGEDKVMGYMNLLYWCVGF